MLRKTIRTFIFVYLLLLPVALIVAYYLREQKLEVNGPEHTGPYIFFALSGAGILLLYELFFFAAFLVFWSLFDLMRSEFIHTHNKILWFILIILLPLIGTVFYLLISPQQKIQPAK
jgi:hypothetical protein